MTWKEYQAEIAAQEAQEVAARSQRQAEYQTYIAALKARHAALSQKIGGLDWLCFLPHSAGESVTIQRAQTYLEKMRSRLAAEGTRMWLCYNHDCQTRIFEISEFRAMHGSVFCRGEWTAIGRKYRHLYQASRPIT